jgi:hypothetical protein
LKVATFTKPLSVPVLSRCLPRDPNVNLPSDNPEGAREEQPTSLKVVG